MGRSSKETSNGKQKSNPNDPFDFAETLRTFASMPLPIDHDVLMQQHRKNIEALSAANTMAAEVMKSISQLQTKFIKQAFDDMASYMRACTQNLKPTDLSQKAEPLRKQVDRMTDHGKNVANLLAQSNRQIYNVFHSRFQEGVEDMKDTAGKPTRKKH
jgi:phasin family protein